MHAFISSPGSKSKPWDRVRVLWLDAALLPVRVRYMRLSCCSTSGISGSRCVIGGFGLKANLFATPFLLMSLGLFSLALSGCKGGGGGGGGNGGGNGTG